MKEYKSIGELLIEYRERTNTSRLDLAAEFNVDVRTIVRWENNSTLLKPEKEEDMVDITFIPYQVIRNLNAPVAIPTFYDFDLRKYAVSDLSKNIPDLTWIKSINDLKTDRLRPIQHKSDIKEIQRCMLLQANIKEVIDTSIILKATKILPELNFIIFDTSGYYSGHSVILPLKREIYNRLKKKEITENEITENDLVDYKSMEKPVFFTYDLSADCNDTLYYITSALQGFFKTIQKSFTTGSYTSREDSYKINEQLGTTLIWEEKIETGGKVNTARFYENTVEKG